MKLKKNWEDLQSYIPTNLNETTKKREKLLQYIPADLNETTKKTWKVTPIYPYRFEWNSKIIGNTYPNIFLQIWMKLQKNREYSPQWLPQYIPTDLNEATKNLQKKRENSFTVST